MKRHKFIKSTAQEIKEGDVIRYKANALTYNVKISSVEKVHDGIQIFGTTLPQWTRVLGDNGWTKELTKGMDGFKDELAFNKKLEIAID